MNAPPTDDLYRADTGGVSVRDAADGTVTLDITFARFNIWNEIDSFFEGRFMERVAPGAFAKTVAERGDQVKVLFNHGHDVLGDIPIGRSVDITEEKEGPVGEVELFDSPDVARILPAIRAGSLGASYRFRVLQEEWDKDPDASDHNPAGLPERTIKEVQLFEFGPVTFPADEGTSIGVRSITDRYRQRRPAGDYRTPPPSSHPLDTTAADAVTADVRAGDPTNEPPERHSEETWKQAAAERTRQLQLEGVPTQ